VVAVLLVAGFAVYHSILHATYGVTPCKGLLKDGMYKVETCAGLVKPKKGVRRCHLLLSKRLHLLPRFFV
jgi:hypothetical protein